MGQGALTAYVLSAVAAEGGGRVLLALVAPVAILSLSSLHKDLADVEEVVDVVRGKQGTIAHLRHVGHQAAGRAAEEGGAAVGLGCQPDATPAEDVKAGEDARVLVEFEADATGKLFLYLLERLCGGMWGSRHNRKTIEDLWQNHYAWVQRLFLQVIIALQLLYKHFKALEFEHWGRVSTKTSDGGTIAHVIYIYSNNCQCPAKSPF